MDGEVITAAGIAWRSLLVGGIIVFAVITGFAYTTLYERKLLARLQARVGPNRAGYIPLPRKGQPERRLLGGVMQPLADAVKLFFKEDITPSYVDSNIYTLAPMISVFTAVMSLAVIPWAGPINVFGLELPYVAIAPGLNIGVLFILAVTSIEVYGIVLAGWASNSKYAILGGIRSTAQMISYELSMGLTLLIPVMIAGSLNMNDIVLAQGERGWFVFLQPLAAIIFFIGALAELQRSPFDLLEAEQELSSGYNVEYAGMRFAMFFMAEYMNMIIFSAIWVTLFWGGYRGPFIDQLPLLGVLYMVIKIAGSLFLMIWVRASLPRLRYDQLMEFGWKFLLPLALLNMLVTAVFLVLAEGM
jgi:NADH-quinone oxidoreductase subunit H